MMEYAANGSLRMFLNEHQNNQSNVLDKVFVHNIIYDIARQHMMELFGLGAAKRCLFRRIENLIT